MRGAHVAEPDDQNFYLIGHPALPIDCHDDAGGASAARTDCPADQPGTAWS